MEKELIEAKEAGELTQEKLKENLERLKAKFTVLENTTVQKHKQALTELELENKRLQQDLASAKLGKIQYFHL